MNCPRCGESKIYHDPRFEAWYCSLCYFRWTWTPTDVSTMEREWTPAGRPGSGVEVSLTLWPSTPDDHGIIEKLLKALDLRDSPDCCIACGGSQLSSRGTACIPCHGTGVKHPHEIVSAKIVYEMKSFCVCGSRHYEYVGTGKQENVYACHKCGKKYRSEKGVFVSLDTVPSNAEMGKAIDKKHAEERAANLAFIGKKVEPPKPSAPTSLSFKKAKKP